MPLKSYSLIIEKGIVRFAPCYDFLNPSIILKQAKEESVLPLRGKKSNLTQSMLVDFLGRARLDLTAAAIRRVLENPRSVLSD